MQGPVEDPVVVKERMEAIIQRNPACREFCLLVGGLLLETMKAAPAELPELEPEVDPERFAKGSSVLDTRTLELDWPARWELATRLGLWLRDRPGGAETAGAIGRLREVAGGERAGAFRGVMTARPESLNGHGAPAQVLWFVLRMALRPAMVAAARKVRERIDLSRWEFGHCPVCGSPPGLAELASEVGARRLHCSLCESWWDYPRLKCPFCEAQEPGIISYLKGEGEEGMQVELCARCGRHIRTVDMRILSGPVILPLDDVATWHLELVLQRERAQAR